MLFNRCIVYLKYSCTKKRAKNVQKRAKTCKNVHLKYLVIKNVHLKYSFIKKTCKNVQKRASQIFLDPIQKRAPARSVQLEAVYLKALLYHYCDVRYVKLLTDLHNCVQKMISGCEQ